MKKMPGFTVFGPVDSNGKHISDKLVSSSLIPGSQKVDPPKNISKILPENKDNTSKIREMEHQAAKRIIFLYSLCNYQNSFGYFFYDPDNPPLSVNDIDEIFIPFPRAKNIYEPGETFILQERIKDNPPKNGTVELVNLPNNNFRDLEGSSKYVGYVIIQNGWAPNKMEKVDTSKQKFYSLSNLNSNYGKNFGTVIIKGEKTIVVEDLDTTKSRLNPFNQDYVDLVFQQK